MYFYFRFDGRHLAFRISVNVDSAISKSGIVENVWVAVKISFVVVIHAQVSCIYADFKVFPVFRPPFRISVMCQIWIEGTVLSPILIQEKLPRRIH